LLSAQATNINGFEHVRDEFSYNEDGNVTGHWYTKLSGQNETYTSDTFVYTNNGQSDIMAGTGTGSANPFTLDNDDNGNITKLPTDSENDTVLWNWDNKLANAQKNTSSIAVKYDPMGNRVWRQSTVDSVTTGRKYIVDISGGLPVILCEIDTSTSSLTKSYIYSDGQILSQRIHDDQDPYDYTPYYYVHDRLGSVRLMIDNSGTAVNSYTYKPYGQFYDGECNETMLDNPWAFTGQYYDEEIAQYYLRARQYDPKMMRFTSRDPAESVRQEPLTLHKYLYCINSPMLYVDLKGESPLGMLQSILDATIVYNETINLTAYFANTGDWDFLTLATFMSRCMLPVMLTGFLDPIFPIENLGEFAEDTIWEYAYEEAFPFFYNFGTKGYLLSGLSSSFINAHYMYGMFTGEFGVTYGEMDDYYEWMGR
jgi:RHS repeat-associated protein